MGTSSLERESLCVGSLLQFSVNSPVPFSVAHGSSGKPQSWGMGKDVGVGQSPVTLPIEWGLLLAALPLTLLRGMLV